MFLNCKTYFSFRYGTYGTEELVREAADLGIASLALTNINNTCDTWDFVDFCGRYRIKPVAGVEIRNDNRLCYILLAKNNRGFGEINCFLSEHLREKRDFPKRIHSADFYTIYPFALAPVEEWQDNERIGIRAAELPKLFRKPQKEWSDHLVIRQPVTYQNKKHYNVHRLLRAIDRNIVLSKQDPEDLAGADEGFVTPASLIQSFNEHPQIITNTLELMNACSIEMDFQTDKTKKVFSASVEDDRKLLHKLALDGMKQRYGKNITVAKARVDKELDIIDTLGFNAYFLITWDILRYANSRGFFYVGRGSGANSIVAYCLRITDVDPIELDLYFERFLNPYRASPPDFDLDFSWKDRDEIIEYVFMRYGREHVCLLGMYTTFQSRAVIRELGKVYGLPKEEIDQLEKGGMKEDRIQRQILYYGNLIKNFPNHLSIHAGGMLISEEPIDRYCAVEFPPKQFNTSQIDMFIAEKIGLFKLDILSQRGLGHIREAIDLVEENQGKSIDIHDVERFKSDPAVAARIRAADTIGCFYIESPAMRQLLQKLRCSDYITLVAASSIIRPGVAQSGMMRQYIHRFHYPNDFEYLHPKMKELLQETYGVMVYQEDVIKVAHHFAGLDMGEADVLRRAMSGKYRSRDAFERIKEKFFNNCNVYGYPPEISAEVWRQIESFGGYSFSKAHSASFAVESYQSLYLKTYFPLEFMVAVINNFGGFYSRELYFHELKRSGAALRLPCVNEGEYLTQINGSEVHVGLIHLQGLEQELATRLLEERRKEGPYLHLQDFIERVRPGLEQLNLLIRVGAFGFTGRNKKELLWEANFLQKKSAEHVTGNLLFADKPVEFKLPVLQQRPLDDALDEIELLGFPLCNVFDLVDESVDRFLPSARLSARLGEEVEMLGYLITSKPVRTVNNEPMYFHTFLDPAGDWLDTVFFPPVSVRYNVSGRGFYAMKGKVVEEFGVYSLEVGHCRKIGIRAT